MKGKVAAGCSWKVQDDCVGYVEACTARPLYHNHRAQMVINGTCLSVVQKTMETRYFGGAAEVHRITLERGTE